MSKQPEKDKVSNLDPKKLEKEALEADAVRGGQLADVSKQAAAEFARLQKLLGQ